jgi:hypothetical protein
MKRSIALAVAAIVLLFVVEPARAAEEREPWSADVRIGNVFMGGERPTGGLSVALGGRREWPLGERFALHAGVAGEIFGFAGGMHWAGLLAVPSAGATWTTPVDGLRVGASVEVPYGRIPTCNDWGLCIRYWGLVPGVAVRVSYASKAVGALTDVSVRYVDTLGWSGVAIAGTAGGFVSF